MTDVNRNAGIVNIPGSVNVAMYVESLLIISSTFVNNHSPQFIQMPSFNAILQNLYTHNVTVYDPDGDCLTYELVACKDAPGHSIITYSFPAGSAMDRINGELTWTSPQLQGEYAFAVKVNEYRNNVLIGYVTRDFSMYLIAQSAPQYFFSGNNTWQVDTSGNYSYTLAAGDTLQLPLSYTDNSALSIDLNAYSETFSLTNPSQFFKTISTYTDSAIYQWIPNVNNVRSAPYIVTFRGKSVFSGAPNLIEFNTDLSLLIYVLDANTVPCTPSLSVNEIATPPLITIFPNPSPGDFTISATSFTNATLFLFDVTGRKLLQQKFNTQTKLNTSTLAAGIYIIELKDDSEASVEKMIKRKLVKE